MRSQAKPPPMVENTPNRQDGSRGGGVQREFFLEAMCGGHMYQTILNAMSELGETPLIFGSDNPQKGESEFQSAFGNKLDQMTRSDGWTWRHSGSKNKEERFKTDSLSNEETIAIDLVGRHPLKE